MPRTSWSRTVLTLVLVGSALAACADAAKAADGQEKKWYEVQPGALPAKDARIVSGPTCRTRADGSVEISFAVDKYCDVAVRVVDKADKTVRHLAAGVLGKNAPVPFLRDSLKQRIVWDGLDDAGKRVKARPFLYTPATAWPPRAIPVSYPTPATAAS